MAKESNVRIVPVGVLWKEINGVDSRSQYDSQTTRETKMVGHIDHKQSVGFQYAVRLLHTVHGIEQMLEHIHAKHQVILFRLERHGVCKVGNNCLYASARCAVRRCAQSLYADNSTIVGEYFQVESQPATQFGHLLMANRVRLL